MNRIQLTELLHSLDVPDAAFSTDGVAKNEAHIIEQQGPDTWCVYYSERGQRSDERFFATEDEACRYVYESFLKWQHTSGKERPWNMRAPNWITQGKRDNKG
jgi:hypothetical protein